MVVYDAAWEQKQLIDDHRIKFQRERKKARFNHALKNRVFVFFRILHCHDKQSSANDCVLYKQVTIECASE